MSLADVDRCQLLYACGVLRCVMTLCTHGISCRRQCARPQVLFPCATVRRLMMVLDVLTCKHRIADSVFPCCAVSLTVCDATNDDVLYCRTQQRHMILSDVIENVYRSIDNALPCRTMLLKMCRQCVALHQLLVTYWRLWPSCSQVSVRSQSGLSQVLVRS